MPEIAVQLLNLMADAVWSFRDNQPRWQHGTFGSSGTFGFTAERRGTSGLYGMDADGALPGPQWRR